MTVETTLVRKPVYAYPLISWGPVLAGAAVAIALGALFAVLGVAIGATYFSPYNLERDAKMITVGGGLWIVFANLVALQVGGFIAARSSRFADHTNGMFQGLAVWAVTLIAAMLLAGSSLSSGMQGAASAAIDQAEQSNAGAATAAMDNTAAVNPPNPGAPALAGPSAAAGRDLDEPTDAEMAQMAQAAKSTTEAIAWWAFAALALGALGAMAGGRLGAAHPAWPDRPREVTTVL